MPRLSSRASRMKGSVIFQRRLKRGLGTEAGAGMPCSRGSPLVHEDGQDDQTKDQATGQQPDALQILDDVRVVRFELAASEGGSALGPACLTGDGSRGG